MNEIEIQGVSKVFKADLFKKRVHAVNDLSFNIPQGQVFGLIGPNGAGKSTTIRMLLGLIQPDEGAILFRGSTLRNCDLRAEIGYLPENPYLYDHLTLNELLAFCGKTSGLSFEEVERRSSNLMGKLNLLEAQRRPIRTFSKGMLQRAGICFALLHDPSIVILDEPMSGLDPIGRKMVFDLVVELKEQGKTIFFCSHILNDVERLCDRIGLINRGKLVRQFERSDFLQLSGTMVFLHTAPLSETQQGVARSMGVKIRNESDGHLLAITDDCFFKVNAFLEKNKISVVGCRSEWITLEDLFMQTIMGEAQ